VSYAEKTADANAARADANGFYHGMSVRQPEPSSNCAVRPTAEAVLDRLLKPGKAPKQAAQRYQGRASRIMLNGVSVARRMCVKPPFAITSCSFASPAWAPSAAPTSCEREVGTQIIVEAE
jgi:hypothetical protein